MVSLGSVSLFLSVSRDAAYAIRTTLSIPIYRAQVKLFLAILTGSKQGWRLWRNRSCGGHSRFQCSLLFVILFQFSFILSISTLCPHHVHFISPCSPLLKAIYAVYGALTSRPTPRQSLTLLSASMEVFLAPSSEIGSTLIVHQKPSRFAGQ